HGEVSLLYRQPNILRRPLVGTVDSRKPLGIMLRFALGPYLDRLIFRLVGIDKIESFVVHDRLTAPATVDIRFGRVIHADRYSILGSQLLRQINGDHALVIGSFQYFIAAITFQPHLMDIKVLGIQLEDVLIIEIWL